MAVGGSKALFGPACEAAAACCCHFQPQPDRGLRAEPSSLSLPPNPYASPTLDLCRRRTRFPLLHDLPDTMSSARLPLLDTSTTLFSIDDEDDDEHTPTTSRGPAASRPVLSTQNSSSSRPPPTEGCIAPYSDDAADALAAGGESHELRSVSPMYGGGLRSTVQSRELGARDASSFVPDSRFPARTLTFWCSCMGGRRVRARRRGARSLV